MYCSKLFWRIIGAVLIAYPYIASSQVVTKIPQSVRFDKNKGIIILYPATTGLFYLNNIPLIEVKPNDTVYLVNVSPGGVGSRFDSPSGKYEQQFIIDRKKVVEIIPSADSLFVKTNIPKWEMTANLISGKRLYSDLTNCFYWNAYADVLTFKSFTTNVGYSIAPGFGIGCGMSYNAFITETSEYIAFLPVFGEIRSHLSSRSASPFIKANIGYNLLVAGKGKSFYDKQWMGSEEIIDYGGLFLSTGIGLRIAATDQVHISVSFDLSIERFEYHYLDWYQTVNYDFHSDKYFRIYIGVGFTSKSN